MCLCHLERLLQHQHFIPPVNKWSNKINYYNSYSYILLCYCRAVAVMLCSVFNLVLLIPLILDLQGAGKLDQEDVTRLALYITYYCGCGLYINTRKKWFSVVSGVQVSKQTTYQTKLSGVLWSVLSWVRSWAGMNMKYLSIFLTLPGMGCWTNS